MSNIPLPWLISLICVTGIIVLWQLWFWIIIFFVSMTISKKKEYSKPSRFYNWIFVLWYRYMMIAGRLNVHVSGYEKVPMGQRFLLVSNHCSKFDNFIQCAVLKKTQIAYISKPENFKIPMGGRFMRRGLYLPIERDNAKEGLKTILKAIDYIKDDKVSVGIFPEGKRGTELQEFKPGAFKIAEKARCPLVVCSMKGTTDIHKNWPWKRTDVYMDVLEVINPSVWNDKTTVDVSNYAHEIIYNDLYNKSNQTKRGTV